MNHGPPREAGKEGGIDGVLFLGGDGEEMVDFGRRVIVV
jgi:hypothetical protein